MIERDVLANLVSRWSDRSAVVQNGSPRFVDLFDDDFPDFPDRLLPADLVPHLRSVPRASAQRVRAAAWIAYCTKVVAIEDQIVLPACIGLIEGRLRGSADATIAIAARQVVIDENFHGLMCAEAVAATRARRSLEDFTVKSWVVTDLCALHLDEASPADRDLLEFAFAVVAESSINALLSNIAVDRSIQPLHQASVALHLDDERRHAVGFKEIAATVFSSLDTDQRRVFVRGLAMGLDAITRPDPVAMESAFALAGIYPEPTTEKGPRPGLPRDNGPLERLLKTLNEIEPLGDLSVPELALLPLG